MENHFLNYGYRWKQTKRTQRKPIKIFPQKGNQKNLPVILFGRQASLEKIKKTKNLQKIVILGGGESGVGAALLAKQKGFDVFVSDAGIIKDQYLNELLENGITV